MVDRPELQRWQSRRSATLSAMFDYSGLVDRPVCRLPPNLICSDGDDQMFIDLAWSHRVDCLFTRDKALLRLSRRAREDGVLVLRPVDLVARASGLQNPQTA